MSVDVLAAGSCLLMLIWLLVTEWVPLAPLNDLAATSPAERLRVGAVNYSVLVVIAGGVITGTTVGAIVAQVLVVVWLVGHVLSWWLPYFGRSTEAQRAAYRREYSRTLKILPTDGHDVVVDVQHMVVGVLTVPMVIFVTWHTIAVLS